MGVQKFSETGEWIASFTSSQNDSINFTRLSGITVDDSGNIFVSNLESYSVFKIDVNGNMQIFWKGYNADSSDCQIGVWWSADNL